jgi:hypothetical protein
MWGYFILHLSLYCYNNCYYDGISIYVVGTEHTNFETIYLLEKNRVPSKRVESKQS